MQRTHAIAACSGICGAILAVLVLVFGIGGTQASSPIEAGAPGVISYQGFLTNAAGDPISGTVTLRFRLYAASSGGSPIWEETQAGVSVGNGFFAVLLGSVTPLGAAEFSDPTRYLQVRVDTGSGLTDLPRQRIAATPYALQAEQAASAPWNGLTGVPAGFADGIDNTGGEYEHVIVVAKSGGNHTSVAVALNSISDASESNRYLVWVAPGVYTETELVDVGAFVHLRGAGPNVSVVASTRTGATPGTNAATARLGDNARISGIQIRNAGTGNYGIAIWSDQATRNAVIEQVHALVNGSGGIGHYGAFLNDAEPQIRDSLFQATGASGFGTAVNAAIGIVNVSGGFPQPLIERSQLIGGNDNGKTCVDATRTGFGLQMVNASPVVRQSMICGGHRGIFLGTNGNVQIQGSDLSVSSTTQAFLIETTGSAAVTIATSGVFYVGNKFTGTGGLVCVHSYKAGYTAATNGSTSGTACN